jgi:hypothetical protein
MSDYGGGDDGYGGGNEPEYEYVHVSILFFC